MKSFGLLFLFISILSFSFHPNQINSKDTKPKKWVRLFNGKDLKNWQPKFVDQPLGENFKNTFRVENGFLSVRYDQYDSFRTKFGALHYAKKFTNYRLRVEYRFVGDTTPGAPSWGYRDGGIQFHGQAPASIGLNQNFPVCLEYNLHGGNGKEERPNGEICANGIYFEVDGKRNATYCTLPAVKKTFHGDQWVTAEIEVKDGVITHYANGEKILEYRNPRLDSAHAQAKTLIVGGNNLLKDGYISIQSNSHPMDFRKIEIMEY